MEINKQLFEDVLSGKLKGTFVLRNGHKFESFFLGRNSREMTLFPDYPYQMFGLIYKANGNTYVLTHQDKRTDIVDFIPDTDMKENELTIEIPKGKIVDWEASQKQNKIIFKEDEQLNYRDICIKLSDRNSGHFYINGVGDIEHSYNNPTLINNAPSEHQLECILAKNQLATVAAYLNDGWQPSKTDFGYFICTCGGPFEIISRNDYKFNNNVIFKSRELAEKAIKILGGETVKLALEPLGI